jgi:hypothetical protein
MIINKGHHDFHKYVEAVEGLTDIIKEKISKNFLKAHLKTYLKADKKWREEVEALEEEGYYDDRNGWRQPGL